MTNNKSLIENSLILSPYLFLILGLNFLSNGDKTMVIFSIISMVTSFIAYGKENVYNNIKNPIFIVAILFSVYLSILYQLQGGSPSLLRSFIAASLVTLFFPKKLLSKKIMLGLILIGSMMLFLNSVYYTFYLGLSRSSGFINVIPYATFCSVFSLAGLYCFLSHQEKNIKLIGLITTLLSTTCVILSLSRGVWLALFFSMITMLFFQFRHSKKMWKYILISLVCLLISFFIFQDKINHRIAQTNAEVQEIKEGNLNTSIGLRLQMWNSSFLVVKNNWLFGVGSSHQMILEELANQGQVSQELVKFKNQHYHNQLIDTLVKYGVFGVLLLIMMYIVPIYLAVHNKLNYAPFIISVSLLYFISGLTDVPLSHSQTIYLYLLIMIPLCSTKS
ncbi:O-antigen ligase family protein [Vibrio cincinnatiensis]|uniref:O-antigen ligase family protein n=1 Tax=Vibrio cincinnatiensis TaxID=675 RepID=UPI001EDFB738|nr:O-antigen ligase family protein [Vibrio cincinnatiensis]MCG3740016.1 O-antigen ligase family protein [Vibrio cincinnatiensis]